MNYKYTSIDRIFSKLIRDVKSDFSESDVIEWCGEALEFIGATRLYEEAVAFIEIRNHQCKLPSGLHSIIQIARNNKWSNIKDDLFCPQKIKDEVEENCEDCVSDKSPDYIILDCNGQPINDYELAYYRPYFDLRYEYDLWRGSSIYTQQYTPIRLTTNNFFNSLVCTDKNENNNNIYQSSVDEYTIIQGDTLRFSFKEGSVAIAYLRQVVDNETGYPMIPDNISYTTAIIKYITMKMFERDFYNGRDGSQAKMQKAESDWQWYCKQAGNVDMMPYGDDEYQNLLDQRSYILPQQNRYYGFFGKMARPEIRKYNDPDLRNSHNYFRGN